MLIPETRARGERHGLAKLTSSAIRHIRLLANLGATQIDIARWFGISAP